MKKLLLTAAALALCAHGACAWTGTNTGSGQLVEQGAAQQQRQTATGGAASSVATGGSARSSSKSTANGGRGGNVSIGSVSSGSSGGGVSSTPVVTVPDGYGNAPCGGGIGIGGAGLGGGGSGGGTLWEFTDCKRMRESAALRSLGQPLAALRELCQIDRVREAMGGACPEAAPVSAPAAPPERYRFDYCYTASAGELRQHRECFSGE